MAIVNKRYVAINRQSLLLVVNVPNGGYRNVEFLNGYGLLNEGYVLTNEPELQEILEKHPRFNQSFRLAEIDNVPVAEYEARKQIAQQKQKDAEKAAKAAEKVRLAQEKADKEQAEADEAQALLNQAKEDAGDLVPEIVEEVIPPAVEKVKVEEVVIPVVEKATEPTGPVRKPFSNAQAAKEWLNKEQGVPFSQMKNKTALLATAKEKGFDLVFESDNQ